MPPLDTDNIPVWPLAINQSSDQADDLIFCCPALDNGGSTVEELVSQTVGTNINGAVWDGDRLATFARASSQRFAIPFVPAEMEPMTLPLTMTAWVRCAGVSGTRQVPFCFSQGAHWYRLVTGPDGSTNPPAMGCSTRSGGGIAGAGYGEITVNGWHHVAMVLRAPFNTELWVDGVNTHNVPNLFAPTGLIAAYIGSQVGNESNYWDGGVYDCRVYARQLGASDFAAMMALSTQFELFESSAPPPSNDTTRIFVYD